MIDLPSRTHSEMVALLDEVDQVLHGSTPAGVMYVLYVIGGVAMSALVDGRLTQDIDVATAEIPGPVLEAAAEVAERHNMPANWINNQAAQFVEAELPSSHFDLLYEGACLMVRCAKPSSLLALKLMSGRGKDVQDIVDLAEATGITAAASLVGLCDEVFAETQSYQFERDWVTSVSEDIGRLLARKRRGTDISEAAAELAAEYDGLSAPGD